jgi:transcriptional regulator with XRE-family HTH domain
MMIVAQKNQKKTAFRRDNPDPIDIHVGSRLRLRRNLCGLSQDQLGKASGLTFQQIQKYERGANRMGASRLFQMAQLLGVTVVWFFDELPPSLTGGLGRGGLVDGAQGWSDGVPANSNSADGQILHRRESLELIRAYSRVTDAKQRRKIYELIKSMADEDERL